MKNGLLKCAAIAAMIPALAQAAPITLTGTVRDFNAAGTSFNGVIGHPDFENSFGADTGIVQTALGADGKPVFNSANFNPTVASAASFYQWYHDDPSVNRTGSITITLNPATATTYQFSSSDFFPIDGALLGQSMLGHNFGFTTEFHTMFTFNTANNDIFSFTGDDDLFVFINGQLVIDLGGVHAPESASVALNGIGGLANGNDYRLDIFHAERHTTGSNFTMTTSLQLESAPTPGRPLPEPGSMALMGLGLVALAGRRRRR